VAIGFALFSELEAKLRVRVRVSVSVGARARVRVGLWLGLGANESFLADCRQRIPADRLPVAGYGYTILQILYY